MSILKGGLLASAVMLALYLPWLPTLVKQNSDVQGNWWLPPLDASFVKVMAEQFVAGVSEPTEIDHWIAGLLVMAVFFGLLWSGRKENIFLLLLIVIPWLGGVAASLLKDRTVILPRYFVFAQLFFLTAVAVLISQLNGRAARACAAGLFVAYTGYALAKNPAFWQTPDRSLDELAAKLADEYRPDHRLVFNQPGEANQVYYYLFRESLEPRMKIIGEPDFSKHQMHAACIPDDEWIAYEKLDTLRDPVIWVAGTRNKDIRYPDHWRLVSSTSYKGHSDTWWLFKFEQEGSHAKTPSREEETQSVR